MSRRIVQRPPSVPYDGLVESTYGPWVAVLAGGGFVVGLILLARGLSGYRSAARVGDTATSTISAMAAGEVRISGTIEPAELTLVSLLQSVPCVYYRAAVEHGGERRTRDSDYTEERAVGFRVRDETGEVRIFPRGAHVEAPSRFQDETTLMGDEPAGLSIRTGGSTQASEQDRERLAQALLTVHAARAWQAPPGLGERHGRRQYRETRLEPGDPVTILGRALPFSDLTDPAGADLSSAADVLDVDPEIVADLAQARAAGLLADDPTAAWGNAGIPGFGIGRPVRAPQIDPAANALALASPAEAARAERTFAIAPETLVLAASSEVPLFIAFGSPGAVVERAQTRFVIGLLGAVLAIVSAMVFAIDLGVGFSR